MNLCPDDVAVQRLVLVHLKYRPHFGDANCGDGDADSGDGDAYCGDGKVGGDNALFPKLIGTFELRNRDPTFYEIGTQ